MLRVFSIFLNHHLVSSFTRQQISTELVGRYFLAFRLSSLPSVLSPHLLDLNKCIRLINICRDLLCVKVLRGNSNEQEQALPFEWHARLLRNQERAWVINTGSDKSQVRRRQAVIPPWGSRGDRPPKQSEQGFRYREGVMGAGEGGHYGRHVQQDGQCVGLGRRREVSAGARVWGPPRSGICVGGGACWKSWVGGRGGKSTQMGPGRAASW